MHLLAGKGAPHIPWSHQSTLVQLCRAVADTYSPPGTLQNSNSNRRSSPKTTSPSPRSNHQHLYVLTISIPSHSSVFSLQIQTAKEKQSKSKCSRFQRVMLNVSSAYRVSSTHKLLHSPMAQPLFQLPILTLFHHLCNSWEPSLA